MNFSQIIKWELEIIRKIVSGEAWIEGERRVCPVKESDPVVQGRVKDILLNNSGVELCRMFDEAKRRSADRSLTSIKAGRRSP